MMPAGMGTRRVQQGALHQLTVELPGLVALAAGGHDVPTSFPIIKPNAHGMVDTLKGVFKCDAKACAMVMEAFGEYGNDLCFDYDHAMAAPGWMRPDPAASGAAAGWFTLKIIDGAIYADGIQWTPRAKAALLAREYRYCSPAFRTTGDGRIASVWNCALTNVPATKKMDAIMASRVGLNLTPEEVLMNPLLLSLLSLGADASEEDVNKALRALDNNMRGLMALTGTTTPAAALAQVQTYKTAAEQGVKATQQAAELAVQVQTLTAEKRTTALSALVEEGIKAGKIAPALKEWALSQTPEGLKAFLDKAPVVVPQGEVKDPGKKDAPGQVALTQEQLAVAAQMGLSPEKFKEHVAKTDRSAVIHD